MTTTQAAHSPAVDFYSSHPSEESAESSHLFAHVVASRIAEAANRWRAKPISLRAYRPPFEGEGPDPHGYLELGFSDDEPIAIGIIFGLHNEDGSICRTEFDGESWSEYPTNPAAADLIVASFDEAWRVVCLTAQLLEAPSVSIAYGI